MRNIKIVMFFSLASLLSACSATGLRCGTDGDSSYVELVGAPQHIASSTRAFSELCGFAYEKETE